MQFDLKKDLGQSAEEAIDFRKVETQFKRVGSESRFTLSLLPQPKSKIVFHVSRRRSWPHSLSVYTTVTNTFPDCYHGWVRWFVKKRVFLSPLLVFISLLSVAICLRVGGERAAREPCVRCDRTQDIKEKSAGPGHHSPLDSLQAMLSAVN